MLYLLKRIGAGLLCLALVTLFVFTAMRLVPGDVVSVQLQNAAGVTESEAEALRESFGLNAPLLEQLRAWLAGVVQGDLGTSFWGDRPVADILWERVPVTLEMGLIALLLAVVGGVSLGIAGASRRGSWLDGATRIGAVVGLSVPHYVFALMVLVALSLLFHWSPPLVFTPLSENPGLYFQQTGIPIIAIALMMTAAVARMTRSAMLESLGSESVRAVRARGGSEMRVVMVHGLRNAGIPILTLIGLELGAVFGGTVILETLFGIPGVGSLTYDAVAQRDYPLVVACTIFFCVMYIVVTIAIDLAYTIIDPRIRTAGVGQ
ncbi:MULTISPECIES: ABC transporter permease [unclassified Microbacterium]|uniref:ABC transporter permease n=1 Tax=unclassified Microbacterium TaxID=2609290 RepID=UPI00214B4044|nr:MULTISPECIES: ABC transporter permease [unclassified Microbacterium]MCR2808394.1 ABC transporter permease [Microbacterium sp. zg.B185]WIM19160.1 ABC transporter permease [Microbacterium sp. zg-B185]